MTKEKRDKLIETISRRELLRPLGRLERFFHDPLHALPYYLLATLSHIKPFSKSFNTLWDTRMTCYLPEGNTFYYYGYCEANLTNFFLRYVEEGMTCIDVGAHVGIYTMLFSELVGNSGSVHSFEPTPWTFKILKENCTKLTNVNINNLAIAEGNRTLTFADYGPGYGAYNSAHNSGAPALSTQPQMTKVESVSLDTYCTEHGIVPDVIKIDSEGFEFEVLQGTQNILANIGARPIISIEVANDAEWAENRNNAFVLLRDYEYICYQISPAGYLLDIAEGTKYQYDNLICVPEERAHILNQLHL